jgi:hypothetical protein
MLGFPIDGLLDEQACCEFLLRILHPDGLHCPRGHPLPADQAPHRRRRLLIPDYRCRLCGAVFNLFTSTIFSKRPAIAVLPSFKSCAASHKVRLLSIWPTNWQSIAPISWSGDTRYRRLWPGIFPPTAPLSAPVTEAE